MEREWGVGGEVEREWGREWGSRRGVEGRRRGVGGVRRGGRWRGSGG